MPTGLKSQGGAQRSSASGNFAGLQSAPAREKPYGQASPDGDYPLGQGNHHIALTLNGKRDL